MNPILYLDYAGVAVFAATGALAASRKQLDIIGFLFLASVTGMGGGTLRDLILDVPVFWTVNDGYVLVCSAAAIVVFFTAHLVESRYKLLLWLDALGLSAYAVLGAERGLEATGSPVIALVMGMLTATFGGIARDVLAGEPSVLLRPEIYVTAAVVGAATYTWLAHYLGIMEVTAALIAFAAAFAVRGGALRFGWTFPAYRSRPGRPPEDVK
ncbi:MAG TPA: trimeric intracellular cation channel family protein [Rhizobiaceae bacterium]|nr:trimeric intracellular cation channel family protein [Rhizobiaceae bacterium]